MEASRHVRGVGTGPGQGGRGGQHRRHELQLAIWQCYLWNLELCDPALHAWVSRCVSRENKRRALLASQEFRGRRSHVKGALKSLAHRIKQLASNQKALEQAQRQEQGLLENLQLNIQDLQQQQQIKEEQKAAIAANIGELTIKSDQQPCARARAITCKCTRGARMHRF